MHPQALMHLDAPRFVFFHFALRHAMMNSSFE